MKVLPGWAAALVAVGVVSATVASAGGPFPPRVPQVVFNSASLQAYLNGQGESINVNTDQLNGQVWTTSVSGNASFTLMIELSGNAGGNSIGVYNAVGPPSTPPLCQIFPGAATTGWHAMAHFPANGNLVVTLFDQNSVIQGQSFYAGVNENGFGFYISGPGGTFRSQDALNPGGAAQILTYAGNGQNFGDWWECFEDQAVSAGGGGGEGGGANDFDDAVLLLQSVVPTEVNGRTWGNLKALYR
jgi:hypothetical protein